MAVNPRVLQLVVGAAILDPEFRALLLADRERAVEQLPAQPCAPLLEVSPEDRAALLSLPAENFEDFAGGVRRLVLAARPRLVDVLPPAAAVAG